MSRFGKFLVFLSLLSAPVVANADRNELYGGRGSGGWYERDHWSERRDFRPGGQQWYSTRPWRNQNHGRNAQWEIRRGIRSGRLSRDEAHDLQEQLRDLSRDERRFRSDGYFSRGEREDLRDDYRDFRRDLRHELTDGEYRDRYYGRGSLKRD